MYRIHLNHIFTNVMKLRGSYTAIFSEVVWDKFEHKISCKDLLLLLLTTRQKLCQGTRVLRRKVWARTKFLIPNIRYFVTLSLLEIFGQKECIFGSKTVFLGREMHYYMVGIAIFTELNLQICNYAQKQRLCRKNGK